MPGRTAVAAPAAGAALALLAAALVVVTSLLGSRRRHYQLARVQAYPDSAPPHARRAVTGGRVVTGNAVRINRPQHELYAFWRDFANLPRFILMENVAEVRPLGDGRSQWTITAPAGTSVTLRTEITEERDGGTIAWRTLPGSDVAAEGRVGFRDPPGGGGTIVEATVACRPPSSGAGSPSLSTGTGLGPLIGFQKGPLVGRGAGPGPAQRCGWRRRAGSRSGEALRVRLGS